MMAGHTLDHSPSTAIRTAALIAAIAMGVAVGLLAASIPLMWIVASLLAVAILPLAFVAFRRAPVWCLVGLWVLQLLQGPAVHAAGEPALAGAIRSMDDAAIAALGIATFTGRLHRQLVPRPVYIPLLVFVLLGVAGSIAGGREGVTTVLGVWFAIKFWLVIAIASTARWRIEQIERFAHWVVWIGLIVGAIGVVEFIAPNTVRPVLGVGPDVGTRGGLPAVKSVFSHPMHYSSFMVSVAVVCLGRYGTFGSSTDLRRYMSFGFMALLSLRAKTLMSLAAVPFALAFLTRHNVRRRGLQLLALSLGAIIALGPIVFTIVVSHVERQQNLQGDDPRLILYETSAQVAADRFPLGAGFGTYGSKPSIDNYSPIYEEYGISSVWGLSERDPLFIQDTSWATILGETGWAGLVLVFVSLLGLTWSVRRRSQDLQTHPFRRAAALISFLLLVTVWTDSATAPSLFDAFSALWVGLFLGMAAEPGASVSDRRDT